MSYPSKIDFDNLKKSLPTTYQTRGNYAFKTEFDSLRNILPYTYQTRGNYASKSDFDILKSGLPATYQTKGNYAFKTDLTPYAKKAELPVVPGNLAFKSDLVGVALTADLNKYALASDLSRYQPVGRYISPTELTDYAKTTDLAGYAKSTDLTNIYQTKGNYALASDFANFQPKGDYALASSLTGFQPKGDYALASALADYQTKADTTANYQPKGNYASASDLANYQQKGDYQPKGDYVNTPTFTAYQTDAISKFQPKGDYALASAFADYQTLASTKFQTKGEYSPNFSTGNISTGSLNANAISNFNSTVNFNQQANFNQGFYINPNSATSNINGPLNIRNVTIGNLYVTGGSFFAGNNTMSNLNVTSLTAANIFGYAKSADLDKYVLNSALTDYQNKLGSDYAKVSALSDYTKSADLVNTYQTKGNYAFASTLNDYAKVSALTDYAKSTDLANIYQTKGNYAFTSALNDYAKVGALTDYTRKSDFANFSTGTLTVKASSNFVGKPTFEDGFQTNANSTSYIKGFLEANRGITTSNLYITGPSGKLTINENNIVMSNGNLFAGGSTLGNLNVTSLTAGNIFGYAKSADLDKYVLNSALTDYQNKLGSDYAKVSALTDYAKSTDLANIYQTKGNYAFTSALNDYAKVGALTDYTRKSDFANFSTGTLTVKASSNFVGKPTFEDGFQTNANSTSYIKGFLEANRGITTSNLYITGPSGKLTINENNIVMSNGNLFAGGSTLGNLNVTSLTAGNIFGYAKSADLDKYVLSSALTGYALKTDLNTTLLTYAPPNFSPGNISTGGFSVSDGNLFVNKNTTLKGLNVDGNTKFNSQVNFISAPTFENGFNTNPNSTSTFSGSLRANGGLTIASTGTLTASGNTSLNNLNVSGSTNLSNVNVTGDLTASGAVNASTFKSKGDINLPYSSAIRVYNASDPNVNWSNGTTKLIETVWDDVNKLDRVDMYSPGGYNKTPRIQYNSSNAIYLNGNTTVSDKLDVKGSFYAADSTLGNLNVSGETTFAKKVTFNVPPTFSSNVEFGAGIQTLSNSTSTFSGGLKATGVTVASLLNADGGLKVLKSSTLEGVTAGHIFLANAGNLNISGGTLNIDGNASGPFFNINNSSADNSNAMNISAPNLGAGKFIRTRFMGKNAGAGNNNNAFFEYYMHDADNSDKNRMRWDVQGKNNAFVLTAGGKVGINMTGTGREIPDSTLEVNGTLQAGDTTLGNLKLNGGFNANNVTIGTLNAPNATIGNLNVNTAKFVSAMTFDSQATFKSGLTVEPNQTATFNGPATFSGRIQANGGINAGDINISTGGLNVGGDTVLKNLTIFTANSTGTILSSARNYIDGNFSVGTRGSSSFDNPVAFSKDTTFSAASTFLSRPTFKAGIQTDPNTESTFSGSLKANSGLTIASAGTLTASGNTSLNNLNVSGSTNLSNVNVTGDLTASGAVNASTFKSKGDINLPYSSAIRVYDASNPNVNWSNGTTKLIETVYDDVNKLDRVDMYSPGGKNKTPRIQYNSADWIYLNGNTAVSNKLDVNGTLNAKDTTVGSLYTSDATIGNLNVTGNVTFGSQMTFDSTPIFKTGITTNADVGTASGSTFNGKLKANAGITTSSLYINNGGLIVSSGSLFRGNLTVSGGNLTVVSSGITYLSNTTVGSLYVSGESKFNAKATFITTAEFNEGLNTGVDKTSTFNGKIKASAMIDAVGINVSSDGLKVTGDTVLQNLTITGGNLTMISSGSLRALGGSTIGNLYVSGDSKFNSKATFLTTAEFNEGLNTGIDKTSTFKGLITANKGLNVTGTLTASGNTSLKGTTVKDGNLNIDYDNAITLNDGYHGMRRGKDTDVGGTVDGPYIYGYRGGQLGHEGDHVDSGAAPGKSLSWNKDGVVIYKGLNVTGDLTVTGGNLRIGDQTFTNDKSDDWIRLIPNSSSLDAYGNKGLAAGKLYAKNHVYVGGDLILEGPGSTNNWVFHTPEGDGTRDTLYIAPRKSKTDNSWLWDNQTQFQKNGNILVSGNIGMLKSNMGDNTVRRTHLIGKNEDANNGFYQYYNHISDGNKDNNIVWDVSGNNGIFKLSADGTLRVKQIVIGDKIVINENGITMNDKPIYFRGENDKNHGIQYSTIQDGPELWGVGGVRVRAHNNTGMGGLFKARDIKADWDLSGKYVYMDNNIVKS